jgi:hypothetical protein
MASSIRRSGHPSRPNAMTCCFFSSLKTLLTMTEGSALASKSMSWVLVIVGRFSGDHVWPVLGVHRGYPEVVMRGAFVVQLRKASQSTASQIEGSVEEVDTGKQSRFRSENELIGFLRERFAEIQSSSRKEGTNERNDHGR